MVSKFAALRYSWHDVLPHTVCEANYKKERMDKSKMRLNDGDVPWRSPKGPNVQEFQGTFKGLLGDQQKNW